MATKKKVQKACDCTVSKIIDATGGLAIGVSVLLLAITVYKMVAHLIVTNKLT